MKEYRYLLLRGGGDVGAAAQEGVSQRHQRSAGL